MGSEAAETAEREGHMIRSIGLLLLGLVLVPLVSWAATAEFDHLWTAAPNATSHKLHKKVMGGTYALHATVALPAVTYTDLGNQVGQTYCYQLQGSNTTGDGPLAPEQCVSTLQAPGTVGSWTIGVRVVP
jgi:hypothetical protein